ncbi:MAG TPA: L-2-amino-thiazoline-4-carboxylic acid hydrolase [Alphaproteobacteria bacterium]|nr:L-2-amino-thiazoline-4-carboxylic acid hydrolase [Alphaproteobacteria bacterium]
MTDEADVPISHLQRRKIESGVLIPFIEACRARFGDAATRELVIATIKQLAAEDGARWAASFGAGVPALRQVVEKLWAGGGSLEVEMLEADERKLDFNVTRCRYAEFYRALGLAELGFLVHCNRDHAMIAGFDPTVELTRTRTIMEGGASCDFRFRKKA